LGQVKWGVEDYCVKCPVLVAFSKGGYILLRIKIWHLSVDVIPDYIRMREFCSSRARIQNTAGKVVANPIPNKVCFECPLRNGSWAAVCIPSPDRNQFDIVPFGLVS
jgi:hypothetical protein